MQIPGTVFPMNRSTASVVRVGQQEGFEQPIVYIGGADFRCIQVTDGQPCVVLAQPFNDIWMVDTAPALQDSSEAVLHLS